VRTNKWETAEGSVAPLGVSRVEAERAYNFALYSRHATHVSLLLYGADDLINPALRLDFDPLKNKSGRVWHCRVPDDQRANARYYAYSVDGESGPMDRFDPAKHTIADEKLTGIRTELSFAAVFLDSRG